MPNDPWAALQNSKQLTPQTNSYGAPQQAAPVTAQAQTPTQTFNSGVDPWQSPQSALMNSAAVPQGQAQQQAISPELQAMIGGQGFTPQTLAQMHAGATEGPDAAGLQQAAQMKRMLGESGLHGPAAVAYQGNVAQQTGYAQNAANRDVNIANANQAQQNQQFGIGQQSQIGAGNMAAANQMALENARRMFESLQANQGIRFNTQTQMMGAQ